MASLVIQYLIKWWWEGRTSAVKSTFGSLSSLDLYTFLNRVAVAYLDRRCMEQRELMGFRMLSLLFYLWFHFFFFLPWFKNGVSIVCEDFVEVLFFYRVVILFQITWRYTEALLCLQNVQPIMERLYVSHRLGRICWPRVPALRLCSGNISLVGDEWSSGVTLCSCVFLNNALIIWPNTIARIYYIRFLLCSATCFGCRSAVIR